MSSIVDKVTSKFTKSSPRQKVLVTGASGYVASQVIDELISHGYHVVGTVRNESTVDKVRKNFPNYGDSLSFAIVPDVAAPGAHDEAVKGVEGVIHTASPFQISVENNEEDLLKPAMQGTKGVLESIKAHNPDVKRVVITSSFASILDLSKGLRPEKTYTEADWNPVTYETAKTADGGTAYCASKTFAEQIAFEFVKEQKPNFDVTTVCPPMVYGPSVNKVDLKKLNTSSADIYRLMDGTTKEVPDTTFYAYTDVRDLAKAHRLAYEKPEAAGQRYLITGGNYSYQMVADILHKIPELDDARVPVGKPGSGLGVEVYKLDASKAERELGLKFTPLEKTITDMAHQFLDLESKA